MRFKKSLGTLVLIATLVVAGCAGPFDNLRAAMAAAPPLVNYLVQKGVIPTQAKADAYIEDFNAGIDSVEILTNEWKSASTTPQKLAAVVRAESRWTDIIARNNFVNAPPQLLEAVQIINAILATAVAFYGGRPAALPGAVPATESALKEYIKAQSDALKLKLQPPTSPTASATWQFPTQVAFAGWGGWLYGVPAAG